MASTMDTICAISTPIGKGGISVVRMSGDEVLNIALSFFACKHEGEIEPRHMYLGNFKLGDCEEKCMMVYFKAPYSFTGEDIVEIQCHGGIYVTNEILDALIRGGARLAEPGEFTKRAFLNGKMTLDESEGVIDVINAQNKNQLRASNMLMSGKLNEKLSHIMDSLDEIIAKIEVAMDYPEEDIEYVTREEVWNVLDKQENELRQLLDTYVAGRLIQNGCKIAIVGKTNAGKSSLLNVMLGYDKAIVTDIQGTTRDCIEGSYIYRDMTFNLVDTAGLRDTDDYVESIGIQRAIDQINECDLILYVVDGGDSGGIDNDIITRLNDKKYILVVNKCDNDVCIKYENIACDTICVSAKNGTNIDLLKDKIYNALISDDVINSDIIITNIRHKNAIVDALKYIEIAKQNIDYNMDLLSSDIRNIWYSIGSITGRADNENVINLIFTKFCVGK